MEDLELEIELKKFLKYITETHVDQYGQLGICETGDELDPTFERVVRQYIKIKRLYINHQ